MLWLWMERRVIQHGGLPRHAPGLLMPGMGWIAVSVVSCRCGIQTGKLDVSSPSNGTQELPR